MYASNLCRIVTDAAKQSMIPIVGLLELQFDDAGLVLRVVIPFNIS